MTTQKTEWVKMKPEELEKLVVDLAKKGLSSQKIGLVLRDEHGIPKAKLLGKKIGKILKESGLEHDSEKKDILDKIENLKKHSEKNKHDYTAKKSLMKINSRLNKINKAN